MDDPLSPSNDVPSRIGRSMFFAAWVVGIALLALVFNDHLDGHNHPNRNLVQQTGSDGVPEVVLRRNRQDHYVSTGAINGRPVDFLIDTGATTVSLSMEQARRLGLPLRMGTSSKTANGVVQTYDAPLDSVTLGGFTVRGLRATVMPNLPGEEALLGMDFLKRFDLIQRGETLTIRLASR